MSQHQCYLLCIGVDTYASVTIPDLKGCVHDAQRFSDYIEQHHDAEQYTLHVQQLLSGGDLEPTRANILQQLQEHLGQAQNGDLAIFYYAGHGSKEKVPPSFGEEDGYAQTLVPSDARTMHEQGYKIRNILDKELRLLLHQIADGKQIDLVVIQDTCHSSGATRQTELVRQVEARFRTVQDLQEVDLTEPTPEPVPRYIAPDAEARALTHWYNHSVEDLLQWYTGFETHHETLEQLIENVDQPAAVIAQQALPSAQHIHLAACDKREFAYELAGKGGVFTTNLLEILAAAQHNISYHDLFNRLRMNIDGAYQQTPDLYVHSEQWTLRHSPFLGQLLQAGELPPERDRDVFNGFYPVVPHGRNGWKIRAGELELLSLVQKKEITIPIEVFLQSESPKGISNATITTVAPEYSTVRFTDASFDRRKHRNQLYGMIAARYLRRWRVPVSVEQDGPQGSVTALFEDYGPRLAFKNYQHDGGPAVRATEHLAKADCVLTAVGDWLELRDAQGVILLQSSAAQRSIPSAPTRAIAVRQGPDEAIHQYVNGEQQTWVESNQWSFSAYLKNAFVPIFDYLKQRYQGQLGKTILVFLKEADAAPNSFLTFLQTHAQQLEYFKPFTKWTDTDQATHIVRILPDGYALHQQHQGVIAPIPVAQPTQGHHPKAGFDILLQLQKICKWQTVRNLYNRYQPNLLEHHVFNLTLKAYTDLAGTERNVRAAHFQSSNANHYDNQERGLVLPLHQLTEQKTPFQFVQHPERPSTVLLQLDVALQHVVGAHPVFVSTLLLDPTYAVLPLQKVIGSNILPPAEDKPELQGTLHLLQIELPRPVVMRHYPDEVEEVVYYIKILMAYKRFDVSGLLQEGLPPVTPAVDTFRALEDPASHRASALTKVPKVGAPGSWLAFTIPLVVKRP